MIEKPITVIVIDDDLDTVDVFSEYLEMKGIKVIGNGYNGKDAVELYHKLKPDIVFLDVLMPHYDGFYAVTTIQKTDPNVKVIMVTADLTQDTADRLEEMNITDIIYKPYEFDDVLTSINRMTQKKQDVLSSPLTHL